MPERDLLTRVVSPALLGSFVPMSVHVGKILRELYLSTGLKMERFRDAVSFSNKTIYYHFGQEDLNTAILRRYEAGLNKLGMDVNIWQLLADKSHSEVEVMPPKNPGAVKNGQLARPEPPSITAEPGPDSYDHEHSVAELLRKAADLLEKQKA
jgi:hypothetical protein